MLAPRPARRTEDSYAGWARRFILSHNKRHPSAMGAHVEDPLPWIGDLVRARRSERIPVVMTPEEARAVIDKVAGPSHLVVKLLYGSGLRLLEALHLGVKDLDFGRHELFVRDPKGRRDRVTTLPRIAEPELRAQLEAVR